MSGGSKPQSTTTSNVTPWGPAQPYLQDAMKGASDWLKNPNSSAVYSGSTVVPFANQSLWGMNNQQNFAQGAGQNMQNALGGIIGSGGFNNSQQTAMGAMNSGLAGSNATMNTATGILGSGAGGGMNVSAGQFNEIYNDLNGNPASVQNLSRMASGQMLGGSNPYLRNALKIANENTRTNVGDAMSAAGRYGSGTMQTSLAKAINDSNTDALFGQYNQDTANMMNANSMIDNARLGYAGQQLNAASGAAGVNTGNVDRRLNSANNLFNAGNTAFGNRQNAAGNLFNAGQQGIGNMTGAYQGAMMPGTTMGQIGSAYEGLAGNYAQEQLDRFNQRRDAPLDAILKANAVFTGSGQLGSNTQQKVYQPPNWGQIGASGLGYALGGK